MGQTLGFISFGRVARAVAKRAAPFGLRMMAYDPFIAETLISDHGVLPATLSEVLSQSDFVSMHAPARPEVHHMLGETHFRQMKPSAVFINTGRGATVNEEALIKALQEGWIAHAALDVLETEPPSHNNPMLSMENVTMTAHVASASARFDEARKRRVGFELSLVLSGLCRRAASIRPCCKIPRSAAGNPSAWNAARTAKKETIRFNLIGSRQQRASQGITARPDICASPGDAVERGDAARLRLLILISPCMNPVRKRGSLFHRRENLLLRGRENLRRRAGSRFDGRRSLPCRPRRLRLDVGLPLFGVDRFNSLGRVRRVTGSEDQTPLLASLSCHGCQSQNGYQDKFTHVNLPCLMTGS